jgi:hypothetical protein
VENRNTKKKQFLDIFTSFAYTTAESKIFAMLLSFDTKVNYVNRRTIALQIWNIYGET